MNLYKFAPLLINFLVVQNLYSQSKNSTLSSLRFIGSHEIPHNKSFKGTTVGGLSGIDYDAKNDQYFIISDDRSAIDPARFYVARIFLTQRGIDSVRLTGVHLLLQANGKEFPNTKQDPAHTPDPESIRYNSKTQQLVWTSEGERVIRDKVVVLQDPTITIMGLDGKYVGEFPLPSNARITAGEKGPRQNGALEGLTFSPDYKNIFTSLEIPLFEDGPEAGLTENNPFVRIYQFDVDTKKNVAQFAYRLDPIAYPAVPENSFKINGISEILSITDDKLLVMERSFSMGRLSSTIKVFLADLKGADNVIAIASLRETPLAHLVLKKLLLNMDDLGIYIDNVEGVTFGPNLPNGHRTLIFVADNNFHPLEKMQFLLFEVMP
jgi:hypothetical protein